MPTGKLPISLVSQVAADTFLDGPRRVHLRAMGDVDTPNCEQRLTRLEVMGTEDHPYRWCPSCKVAHLS